MAFVADWWWIALIVALALTGLKVVNEFERGVRFTLGRYSGIMKPGLRLVIPIIQSWQRMDLRVRVVDVPGQDAITKDNVSVKVNAVLYYQISDSTKAVLEVEHFDYAVSQLAQTTMRNIVGETSLDDVLSKRDSISKRIQQIVDKDTDPWGIKVNNVELKDIELPQEMKRVIAQEAEAEREKRAVIIKAQGEVIAADNLAKAAKRLSESKGALHLRTLQTLSDVSADQNNTIILTVPLEVLHAIEGFRSK